MDAAADKAVPDAPPAVADLAAPDAPPAAADKAVPDAPPAVADKAVPDAPPAVADSAPDQSSGLPTVMVSADNSLQRYSLSGMSLGLTYIVPWHQSGNRPAGETVRDLLFLPGGELALYNGTFDAVITIFQPGLMSYNHFAIPHLATRSNVAGGGLALYGATLYATARSTATNPDPQVCWMNATKNTGSFAPPAESLDITLGLDKKLYVLDPTENALVVHGTPPPSLLKKVPLAPPLVQAVAVSASGEIYAALANGEIHRLDASGQTLASIVPKAGMLIDIDLAGNVLVASSSTGNVVVTDATLAMPQVFSTGSSPAFVALIPGT